MTTSRISVSGMSTGWCRAALAWCVMLFVISASAAHALDPTMARQHVEATIEDILQLVVGRSDSSEIPARLLQIVERRASVEQVARFAAGRYWKTMSESERAEFTRAFSHYLAAIYAENFRRFDGSVDDLRRLVRVRGTQDAGAKALLSAPRSFSRAARRSPSIGSSPTGRAASRWRT